MMLTTSISAVVLLLISIRPAHAYIDPGSGSYLFQIALAGILAIVYSLKLFWQKIKLNVSTLVRSRRGTQTQQPK